MLRRDFSQESELAAQAGEVARRWYEQALMPLRIALRGELGSGKTTWVRAMLRGLGFDGRVPSPTYTLLESYPMNAVTVVHFDLYRLNGAQDLENLGFRDWFAESSAWLFIEWPERGGDLPERCDLELDFEVRGGESRRLSIQAHTSSGEQAMAAFSTP